MTAGRWRAACEQIARHRSAAGIGLPALAWRIASRGAQWAWRKLRGPVPFRLGGEEYVHMVHPFILDNERTVEVPVALRAVARHRGGRMLEVGHVLSAYAAFPHVVVDKYERGSGVVNEDVMNHVPEAPPELVVSVSTVEHVGWDETPRDPDKARRALERMAGWLAPGGELLVTFPLGYHPHLDADLWAGRLPFDEVLFLKRISRDNRWREAAADEVRTAEFGRPFPCANAIVVGRRRAGGATR